MNIKIFTDEIRSIASELKPFITSSNKNSLIWNGDKYVKTDKEKTPDPYALAWWTKLNTIADLLDAQETAINKRQFKYLESVLFGGMGSLNDFYISEKNLGEKAKIIKQRLDEKRANLFKIFQSLK